MKHTHTTNTIGYTTHWARVVVPLMLLAAFVLGATPERARADKVVIINQPDDYFVLDPIAERHGRRVIVEEPEPSWVVVGTAPPPLRFEVRPPRPFAGAVWVSGYWWWSGVRYVWIGGRYIRPLAGYRFVGPRWVFSGGYYYHVRGYYRPVGATVRHAPYRHYRQVGYYGHHHPQGYRYTTRRSYPQAHGGHYGAHDDKPRGHGKGHYRTHDDKPREHGKGYHRDRDGHDGRGHGSYRGHDARRVAPVPPRTNPSRGARATPQRTRPSPRASSGPRPARPSRVAPVARRQGSRSAGVAARGNPRRGSGAVRTRQ
ncbi:MAG: hypothetical protein WAU39_21450 [Polyangiales bacterium]